MTSQTPQGTMPNACQRCGTSPIGICSVSRFNTDWLCEHCLVLEKEHPEYERAAGAERALSESNWDVDAAMDWLRRKTPMRR